METNIEMLEGNQAKITVTIATDQVNSSINKAYKDFAKRYNFPGFRKGKAPKAVIDSALGADAVATTVTEQLVEETCPLAIDESMLFVVGDPSFEDQNFGLAKYGEDFVYSFKMNLRIEAELSNYDPVEITMPADGASDAEVDQQIEIICAQYAAFEDAESGTKAAAGDRLVLNLEAADDKGEALKTLTTENFQYTIGSGLFPEAFDTEITGAAAGDKLEFTMPLGDSATAFTTPYMGKTENISFKAEVTGVKVKKSPELTDEWVEDNFGFESVEEFRNRVSESIVQQKEETFPMLKESKCLAALIERIDVELPETMVDEAESNLLQDFFRQLQQSGQTFDAYLKSQGITNDAFKDDVKHQAQDMVKQNMALDAWAKHFELEATEGEIEAEFIKAGSDDWESLYENWKQQGRIHLVREGVLRTKAMDDIIEGAQVTEATEDSAEEVAE